MCADDEVFAAVPLLAQASVSERIKAMTRLLDHMRKGLAVETDALDVTSIEALARRMRTTVKAPWAISVTIAGTEWQITDIGMRMLEPHELYAAQGFPPDYQIRPDFHGKPMTKTAQVRLCGNSVCPPVAEALVRVNLGASAKADRILRDVS